MGQEFGAPETGKAAPQDGPSMAGVPLVGLVQGVQNLANTMQVSADAAAASGAAGYRFDPDTAQAVIDEIQSILDGELMEAQDEAKILTEIQPPGDELASQNYVVDANSSGESYNRYLKSTVSYLQEYRDSLIMARERYFEQERETVNSLKKVES